MTKAWTRNILIAGCVWGVVYGLLNGLSNILLMPSATFISVRPQIALPMAVGILVNPLAGFVAGFLGNVIGDGISGFGAWTFWNWHIANGIMGLVPGLIRYIRIEKITTVRDFGILEIGIVLASVVGVAVAVVLDVFFIHAMTIQASLPSWILPAFLTDAVNGFILVPVILIVARRMLITLETRTIVLVTILLLLGVFCTATAITWSVLDELVSQAAVVKTFYIAGIVSVFLLIVGFLVSVAFVRKFTDPLTLLTQAAQKIEEGQYDLSPLDGISHRKDELGQLSRVFKGMAGKVREREEKLQLQVEALQIRIDRKRKDDEVREIVETDYFQELKKKAKAFRDA